jgi:hypothetical protein
VRGVHDNELVEQLSMHAGERPRDDTAPIVPNDVCTRLSARANHGCDVVDEASQVVRVARRGTVREVVAAKIGGGDREAGIGERADLMTPGDPVLRKAVEKHDQRPVAGPDDV